MAFLGVYGHVNVDHVLVIKEFPRPDQTVPVEKDLVRLGGTGGNIARAAASLGVPTALAACIGDDFPAAFRQQLETASIDLTDLRHVAGQTPKIWIMSLSTGEQSCIIDQAVMGDGVARPHLDYTLLSSDWVHFTTGPPSEHYEHARQARKLGKKVGFDPAQELSYRYPGRLFEKFLNESDVFFCNAAELPRAMEALGYADVEQLLDHTKAIVATAGEKGSRLITEKGEERVPACPVRGGPPKQAVGAGDVHRAGFYAALHAKRSMNEALRWASAASSLFLETGGETFPTRDALTARLESWAP